MSLCPLLMTIRRQHVLITCSLIAALSACNAEQEQRPPGQPVLVANERNATAARGEVVSEMSKSLWYVYQAKNGDYWFGSDDRGVYRLHGSTLINFTTKDGLCSNQIRGIQEDKAANIYFTTYAGIGKFDGEVFMTLSVSATSAVTDWKLQPDDLWFVGPPDAGVVYRYDGESLHRLEFPKTKLGDEHLVNTPRSKYPNAKYSPYDVYCILKDSKGSVWFGTTCVGVCRYDGKNFHWITDNGLVGAPIRGIFEDRKGNYWFTCSGAGLIDGVSPIRGFGEVERGAEGTLVEGMSIVEDGDGKIWASVYGGGAIKYDGSKMVHYPIEADNKPVTTFAIYKDNQGVLWLGTHHGGAYKFNGKAFEEFRP